MVTIVQSRIYSTAAVDQGGRHLQYIVHSVDPLLLHVLFLIEALTR